MTTYKKISGFPLATSASATDLLLVSQETETPGVYETKAIERSLLVQNSSTAISGSGVMSATAGSVVKHNASGITAETAYLGVKFDQYGHATSGSVLSTYATTADGINSGSSQDQFMTPYSATRSVIGTKSICMFRSGSLVQGDTYMRIPVPFWANLETNNWNLTGFDAFVSGSGSGSTIIQINNGTEDVLSTRITIEATEFTSQTAVTQPVISASLISLANIRFLDVDIDGSGSGTDLTIMAHIRRN